jgi:hypothetical protein
VLTRPTVTLQLAERARVGHVCSEESPWVCSKELIKLSVNLGGWNGSMWTIGGNSCELCIRTWRFGKRCRSHCEARGHDQKIKKPKAKNPFEFGEKISGVRWVGPQKRKIPIAIAL